MALRLLHLSDIHFKCYKSSQYLDLDKDIQNEVERDLEDLSRRIGSVDVILIGGDIAFSGKDEEYQIAELWIKKIGSIVGCRSENVLMVPGNHDIDRSKICPMIAEAQKAFKSLRRRVDIDRKLEEYLVSETSSLALLKPLDNYSNFAQRYGSIPEKGNLLFWEKDFQLNTETVRIRGVNSALISNALDDEHTSKLILGTSQTQLLRSNGVINIVLCHHPPQWLYDGEEAQADLLARAKIHLFGHKHKFNVTKMNDSLVLSAGAMQPSRNEDDWEPRFNLIELNTSSSTNNKLLSVKIWKRVWDKNRTKKFIANFDENGGEFEEHSLIFEKNNSSSTLQTVAIKGAAPVQSVSTDVEKIELIDVNTPNPTRVLAYMFLGLPYHKRIRVASDLGLIDETDKDLTEVQKSQAYFKRAQDRGLLKDLWNHTVNLSADKPEISNPF